MGEVMHSQYQPDVVSPPGETLREMIDDLGMTQAELARRTGRPKKTINEIIQGKGAITPRTALQLERVLGAPASFWNARQQRYDEHIARLQERQRLEGDVDWLHRFPLRDMIRKHWINGCQDEVDQLRELLGFFGVASPHEWETVWGQYDAAFRRTSAFKSNREEIAAWLRQGEIQAQAIDCQPYDADAFVAALKEVRSLTLEPPEIFQPRVQQLGGACGVAIVFVPQLPRTRVSGATRWLSPDKALVQLSLRYRTDDHLWFTFFHEAGHILLHGKRDVYLEGDEVEDAKEQEADLFAQEILIPRDQLGMFVARLPSGRLPSTQDVRQFASSLGIAPGIVVGRLQHDEYVPYSHYNRLKARLQWASEET
jgi:HTH-type transcriptional regulator/antitoxin HigA